MFKLCLQCPPESGMVDTDGTFDRLGESLRRHPEAADVLLAALDGSPRASQDTRRSEFARNVFRGAGPAMLPRLHEALGSKDGVVRSNAANACGAVGDRSSVPHLMKALDLEHFAARRAIVLALGELKAREALPLLVESYSRAREEEERGRKKLESESSPLSSGMLSKQHRPWPQFGDCEGSEVTWDAQAILDAVRAIGPALSQKFYREMASDSSIRSRMEAAQRMADCDSADAKLNEPRLRMLLTDKEELVRMEAAVSLLVLGHHDVEPSIIAWIESEKSYERYSITWRLDRVKDAGKLAFARASLERLVDDPSETGNCRDSVRWLLKRMPGGL